MRVIKKKGFTLLELLVVVGIIALLLSIAVVSYSGAQKRARDSKRRSDLKAMQGALEQYYGANSNQYPVGDCSVAKDYMNSAWPADPVNAGDNIYSYSGVDGCLITEYCLCAKLEAESGGNASDGSCTWSDSGSYFCVANLQ